MILDMLNTEKSIVITKTLIMSIFVYYTNLKITNKKININSFLMIIITGIACGLIRCYINYITGIISLLIVNSIIFLKENIGKSALTTIISIGINYAVDLFAVVLGFWYNKIFNMNDDFIRLIVMTITHVILLASIFKIKKFKYGILFLQKTNNNEFVDLVILNISVIILFSVIVISNSSLRIVNILVSLEIIIYAILMFITIKKSLQLYYKQKLLVQELEETKEDINKNH